MARQARLPLLRDRGAAEELREHVAEEVADAEEEEAVAGPAELGVHAEELEVLQDQRALEAAQPQHVELGRDADPQVVPRVELGVELPDVQAHAVVRRLRHEDRVRDADQHAYHGYICHLLAPPPLIAVCFPGIVGDARTIIQFVFSLDYIGSSIES